MERTENSAKFTIKKLGEFFSSDDFIDKASLVVTALGGAVAIRGAMSNNELVHDGLIAIGGGIAAFGLHFNLEVQDRINKKNLYKNEILPIRQALRIVQKL